MGTSLLVQWLGICLPMHGFSPCLGKISHSSEQLSPWTTVLSLCSGAQAPQLLSLITTTEVCTPRACAPQQENPLWWDAWAPQLENRPPVAVTARESPHAATQTREATANTFQEKDILSATSSWALIIFCIIHNKSKPKQRECIGRLLGSFWHQRSTSLGFGRESLGRIRSQGSPRQNLMDILGSAFCRAPLQHPTSQVSLLSRHEFLEESVGPACGGARASLGVCEWDRQSCWDLMGIEETGRYSKATAKGLLQKMGEECVLQAKPQTATHCN